MGHDCFLKATTIPKLSVRGLPPTLHGQKLLLRGPACVTLLNDLGNQTGPVSNCVPLRGLTSLCLLSEF